MDNGDRKGETEIDDGLTQIHEVGHMILAAVDLVRTNRAHITYLSPQCIQRKKCRNLGGNAALQVGVLCCAEDMF